MTTFKLEQYKNFESLEELNHHVSQHVKNNQLNDTQYRLLTILSQHSVKYLGASYLKNNTLADLLNMTKRSVQRNLKVLVDLGIIKKVSTLRPVRGGSGSNIFVIQEYVKTTKVIPSESSRNELQSTGLARVKGWLQQEETTSSKSSRPKYLVTPKSSKIDREHSINHRDVAPSHIPTSLAQFMIQFFDSATINRMYYTMNRALEQYEGRADYDPERLLDLKHRGFRALVTAIKNHNYNPAKYPKINNLFSYLYMCTMKIGVADEFSFVH